MPTPEDEQVELLTGFAAWSKSQQTKDPDSSPRAYIEYRRTQEALLAYGEASNGIEQVMDTLRTILDLEPPADAAAFRGACRMALGELERLPLAIETAG
ncbi:hypothetical protein [Pseudolysinimonas sp.]|uniref:hypothetical protein n=1 Tax=Pseudolysinimonas sp. TaxID=2680009 RepID=UPI003F7EAF85